ncbi:hypothetical protein GCM10010168_78770 [Actinoplanes ianthinogenes]|uniref:ABM domain-containing protein n=1 Tax=Actinoplanes ianthinogenes TaxID=122358 RepID=A0ABM7LK84_9ACTN|nr:antibiotic biosynthesis monooxygenase [Actinoplanes ianthinogenes]BCJ39668.1 hypothetical protein Aiant_03250 [Actinoplanes ianthinogenes]GGR48227.1 hypothetical protein GCM10010168_78770 [Actinoplanes ianthinogenes]
MSEAFGLVVQFTLHDEPAAAAFDALVERTVAGIATQEPGTVAYLVHRVADRPLVRVFYELYADKAAFDAHEQQPHTVRFLAERGQFVSRFEVTWLQAPAGKMPAV